MRITTMLLVLCAVACLSLSAQESGGGYLVAKVSPGSAGVYVDGKYVGPASNFGKARTYAIAAGGREIRLVDPRYEEVVRKVSIQPGKKTQLAETLKLVPLSQPPYGVLRTQHPDKFAAVYVNSKFYGHVDEFDNVAQGLLLNPGEYEVKVAPTSGPALTRKMRIEAGKTVVIK